MLQQTVTHYAPHDDHEERAICGALMAHPAQHSCTPTCPTCAGLLAYETYREDAGAALDALDDQVVPLDAAEVSALEPVDVPAMSPLGAQVFALGVALNRSYARALRGRRR